MYLLAVAVFVQFWVILIYKYYLIWTLTPKKESEDGVVAYIMEDERLFHIEVLILMEKAFSWTAIALAIATIWAA